MNKSIRGKIGRKTISLIDHYAKLSAFTWQLLRLIFIREKEGRLMVRRGIVEQIYFTAVQALPIIIPIALIVGLPLLSQLSKLSAQYDTGRLAVVLVVREIGPILTALVVTLRSATAVTIELGYMSILKEIEALEIAGINPLRLICLPRLMGITVAIVCLFIVFDIIAIAGSASLLSTFSEVQLTGFIANFTQAISGLDIAASLVKAFCFGLIISLVCMFRGLSCKGNFTLIAINTSKACMESFFLCLLADIFIMVVFYA